MIRGYGQSKVEAVKKAVGEYGCPFAVIRPIDALVMCFDRGNSEKDIANATTLFAGPYRNPARVAEAIFGAIIAGDMAYINFWLGVLNGLAGFVGNAYYSSP